MELRYSLKNGSRVKTIWERLGVVEKLSCFEITTIFTSLVHSARKRAVNFKQESVLTTPSRSYFVFTLGNWMGVGNHITLQVGQSKVTSTVFHFRLSVCWILIMNGKSRATKLQEYRNTQIARGKNILEQLSRAWLFTGFENTALFFSATQHRRKERELPIP